MRDIRREKEERRKMKKCKLRHQQLFDEMKGRRGLSRRLELDLLRQADGCETR